MSSQNILDAGKYRGKSSESRRVSYSAIWKRRKKEESETGKYQGVL